MITVLHEVHSFSGEDAHGNATEVWAEPVARTAQGWAPASSSEPKVVGRDRVVVERELFSNWPAAPKDRIILDGSTYLVVGESEDWNRGPFGFAPGYVINLRRTDG